MILPEGNNGVGRDLVQKKKNKDGKKKKKKK